jgi:hypothetical protein
MRTIEKRIAKIEENCVNHYDFEELLRTYTDDVIKAIRGSKLGVEARGGHRFVSRRPRSRERQPLRKKRRYSSSDRQRETSSEREKAKDRR